MPLNAATPMASGESTYESTGYGFTINLPASWEEKYEIVDDPVEGVLIRFVSSEDPAIRTDLASIKKLKASEYLDITTKKNIELIRKQEPGENSDIEYVYAMYYEDGVLPGEDTAAKETYTAMLEDLPEIAKSFKLIE
jgi:hypothetical protein